MQAVFDTNIFVSAFAIPGGKAEIAYRHAIRGTFQLVASVAILTETANILKAKLDWFDEKLKRLLKSISQVAKIHSERAFGESDSFRSPRRSERSGPGVQMGVSGGERYPHLSRNDEPDNRILECAIDAEADTIVTGDSHLLSIKHYRHVSIVTLADFLRSLKGE